MKKQEISEKLCKYVGDIDQFMKDYPQLGITHKEGCGAEGGSDDLYYDKNGKLIASYDYDETTEYEYHCLMFRTILGIKEMGEDGIERDRD